MSNKKTVAVDFDGVIHSYASGWQGAGVIGDPPVPGAIEWLRSLLPHFWVVVHSARAKSEQGYWAIRQYLETHGLDIAGIEISHEKPPAIMYVDDRAWRFTGDNFPTVEELRAFRPWNHQGP